VVKFASVTVVLGVDKLINIPVVELVPFGITQDADVPWIVRPAFTAEKALNPTLTVVDADVYPRLIVARLEHVLKALAPIVVTLLGIVNAVNPVQPLKELAPIVVTLLGIVKAVNPVQPLKELVPIIVTVDGIVSEVIVVRS
jgi:hypothetical protein